MSEERTRYSIGEMLSDTLSDNRTANSSHSKKSLDTLTILTDIKQLENKTVILIDVNSFENDLTLYYTSDHCLLVQEHLVRHGRGYSYIETKTYEDIHSIFELYEEELWGWDIISQDELKTLKKHQQENIHKQKLNKEREKRYKQYLQLKKEFEVDEYK